MAYRAIGGCAECPHKDENCQDRLNNITPNLVFQNVESKKLYIFIHDQDACGCMTEVEEC